MSTYIASLGLQASGTIQPCTFVKLDTANDLSALPAGAGGIPIGISGAFADTLPLAGASAAPEAVAGEYPLVYPAGATCLLTAGTGGWNPGAWLKPDANSNGIATTTAGDIAGAIALTAAAAGERRRVLVISPHKV